MAVQIQLFPKFLLTTAWKKAQLTLHFIKRRRVPNTVRIFIMDWISTSNTQIFVWWMKDDNEDWRFCFYPTELPREVLKQSFLLDGYPVSYCSPLWCFVFIVRERVCNILTVFTQVCNNCHTFFQMMRALVIVERRLNHATHKRNNSFSKTTNAPFANRMWKFL